MNIEEVEITIVDQKRKANLLNNIAIDFEHIKNIVPQILYSNVTDEKIKFGIEFSEILCDRMLKDINDLRNIILDLKK